MRLVAGWSWKTAFVTLTAAISLGIGGIAIADDDDDDDGMPNTDHPAAVFELDPAQTKLKECPGEDGPYVELRQTLTGEASSADPRFEGNVIVHSRSLTRTSPEPPEPVLGGQAFGTVVLKNEVTGARATGRFVATIDEPPTDIEGVVFGFNRGITGDPVHFGGRMILNFTANTGFSSGSFGDLTEDDTENTANIQKGDCGLGFSEAFEEFVDDDD
jgi:hypothetical protein